MTNNAEEKKPNFIARLWKKYATKEMLLYLVFGVATTVVNYIVYYAFMQIPIAGLEDRYKILGVNIIAWIFAVAFAFVTNKLFVFESKSFKPGIVFPEIGKFVAARLLSLGFEELFLFLSVTLGGMNEYLAKILAAVFVVIMNYFASKLLIFRHKKGENS